MKKLLMSVAVLLLAATTFAQTPGYEFTTIVSHKTTPVKDQASTGTCWCFAAASFMESELLRMGKGEYDLSEMFIVRQKYMNQMEDNYLRRGKGNIGEGSLAHTFKNAYLFSLSCALWILSENIDRHKMSVYRYRTCWRCGCTGDCPLSL